MSNILYLSRRLNKSYPFFRYLGANPISGAGVSIDDPINKALGHNVKYGSYEDEWYLENTNYLLKGMDQASNHTDLTGMTAFPNGTGEELEGFIPDIIFWENMLQAKLQGTPTETTYHSFMQDIANISDDINIPHVYLDLDINDNFNNYETNPLFTAVPLLTSQIKCSFKSEVVNLSGGLHPKYSDNPLDPVNLERWINFKSSRINISQTSINTNPISGRGTDVYYSGSPHPYYINSSEFDRVYSMVETAITGSGSENFNFGGGIVDGLDNTAPQISYHFRNGCRGPIELENYYTRTSVVEPIADSLIWPDGITEDLFIVYTSLTTQISGISGVTSLTTQISGISGTVKEDKRYLKDSNPPSVRNERHTNTLDSKIVLSPSFGHENTGDGFACGCLVITPDDNENQVDIVGNTFVGTSITGSTDGIHYVKCAKDWGNLNSLINYYLNNMGELATIAGNARTQFVNTFSMSEVHAGDRVDILSSDELNRIFSHVYSNTGVQLSASP